VARCKAGTCFILLPCSTLRRSFCTSGSAPTFKKTLYASGMGRVFNQAMLNQNTMIRRHSQRSGMGVRSTLVLFSAFHRTMLTRFPNAVISLALYI
jgi:hypothetical protein